MILAFPNPATLEIQPANGTGERRRIPSTLHTFANKRLILSTGEPLAMSTAVGLEYNDVLFVGEVVRCTLGTGDQWTLEIKVAHTLTGLQSLMILRAQLDQFQTPIMPEFALVAKKSPIAIDQYTKLRKQPQEPKH